jgi:hypothetical protein
VFSILVPHKKTNKKNAPKILSSKKIISIVPDARADLCTCFFPSQGVDHWLCKNLIPLEKKKEL